MVIEEQNSQGLDRLARTENHWRQLLHNMLCNANSSEYDGLAICIRDALSSSPFGYTRNVRDINLKEHISQPEAQYNTSSEEQGHLQKPDSSIGVLLERSAAESYGHGGGCALETKYQNVFRDILCSDKFALLCDLLCQNFEDSGSKKMLDFGIINANMKNGVYEGSPVSFCKDIQQLWERFQHIGQEMLLLSTGLIDISRDSFQKQVGKDWVHETSLQKCEEVFQTGDEQKNPVESWVSIPLANGSERSSKPDLTETSCHEVQTCKICGMLADGQSNLVCDGCEGIYHISCAQLTAPPSDSSSWYCTSCDTRKKEFSQHLVTSVDGEGLHRNCAVCECLGIDHRDGNICKADVYKMTRSNSRESSVLSMEADGPPQPSQTALRRLCKQCGTCEEENKRFLICGHALCLYKFYHIKCLKSSQRASEKQKRHNWYCPSCLCRACLSDKDDDKIVMCDGCDEAYHIYCMNPPRYTIPKGIWYCVSCHVRRVMEGMKNYEQSILQQHGIKDALQENGVGVVKKALRSAAEKLNIDGGEVLLLKDK